VSMLADVSSEMLTPVTPIFLTTVIGASALDLGIIEGIAEATASLLKTFSGAWSDRLRKRKPFIVIGYLLTAIAKPCVGLSQTWIHVLSARTLDRFGKGIRGAPRDALLADCVEESERGAAFGWHRAMDTTGAIIGPLVALALMAVFAGNLRLVFFVAFIPGLFSVICAALVKESPVEKVDVTQAGPKVALSGQSLSPTFKAYILFWGIFCLVNSSDAFLILRAKDVGYSTYQIILIYCLYNFIYAGASPVLGNLADSWGKKQVLCCGLAVFAVVYLGFAWVTAPWQIIVLFAIYGLYAAATDGVGKSLAVDYLPKEHRAYGLGILGMFTGFATLFASAAAGWLWDKHGPPATFLMGAVGAVIAAVAIATLRKETAP
jgi:MFS family permease